MSIDATDLTLTSVPVDDGDGSELIGTTIDHRYRLDGTIGRGGMGLVYRATHTKLGRRAAVKILHPSLAASTDVRNRFEREALASGKIDHPNCVAVYDSGHLPDGSIYLAMELLEGEALADVLQREGQLAPHRALHILAHLLRGLQHIHESGLVHRDIKPENIFLVHEGDDSDFAKILDFGIAKPMSGELSDDGVKLTQAGMAFGTPIYMAPEQALGNKLDGRADVYAAAIVGYEMLAGQPPFYSDDKLEVMSMHTAKPVPPMRHRLIKGGKPVASSLEKLVVRGLTKKPSERYADANAFLHAIERVLSTKDGGSTDVVFERPNTTGSHSLVTETGSVRIAVDDEPTGVTDTGELAASESEEHPVDGDLINAAIDEALAAAAVTKAPKPVVAPRGTVPKDPATPARGTIPATRETPMPRGDTAAGVGMPRASGTAGRSVVPPPSRSATPGRGTVPPSTVPARDPRVRPPTPPPPVPGERPSSPRTANPSGAPPPRGGVGLGLPYTGPGGEPIFGLTPEQRLDGRNRAAPTPAPSPTPALPPGDSAELETKAWQPITPGTSTNMIPSAFPSSPTGMQPTAAPGYRTGPLPIRKPRRWPLYAGVVAVAAIAGVTFALLTHHGNHRAVTDDDRTSPQFALDAYAALGTGDLVEAQRLLDANKPAAAQDGLALLVQGLIYVDSDVKKQPDALEAFRKALLKDGALGSDPKLRLNLKTMAASSEPSTIADAFDVWIATGDPEAVDKVALAAVAPDNPVRRHAAKKAIDRHKSSVKVDWLQAYALDLQDETTCVLRKEALGKLHALADRRAIPIIQEAMHFPRNACLVADAKNTVGYLNQLP